MQQKIRILGISGSTRSASLNTKLLHALSKLAPSNVEIEVLEGLEKLPFYNEDLEGENLPRSVAELRQKVGAADGIIISSPEYNYSFSALTKNTIDWLSRPYSKGVLSDMPVAITGASPGVLGTVRSQNQLRQVLHATNSKVLSRPEVYVGGAHAKFDEDGAFADEAGRDMLIQLIDNLVTLIEQTRENLPSELAS